MDRIEALSLESEVRYALTSHKHKEAVDLAFAALKEQERGCEYCIGLSDAQREDFTMPNASKKDYAIVTIKFCPMCGRKLGGAK